MNHREKLAMAVLDAAFRLADAGANHTAIRFIQLQEIVELYRAWVREEGAPETVDEKIEALR